MLKDKYKIILIKENHFELKQFSISFLKLITFFSVIICFVFVNMYFFSGDIFNYFEYKEIEKHRLNNEVLVNTINNQNEKINQISKLVDSLRAQEEKFRKLVKLPSIHNEIKQVGASDKKNKTQSLNNLEYLLPEIIDLSKTSKQIDNLYRLINLEILSYCDILDVTKDKIQELVRYPAIHPVNLSQCRRSSGYGYRRDPFTQEYKMHGGVDYSAVVGTPVYATADGTVRISRYYSTFGNYIEINHGYGYKTCYGHLSKRSVKVGEKVERGDKIGEIGNTGRSTAPHLHYEVQHNKRTKNPDKFYFDLANFN